MSTTLALLPELKRYDMELMAHRTTRHYTVPGYLSDDAALVQDLSKAVLKKPGLYLLQAPTGSGKSFLLTQALPPVLAQQSLVLAVPTSLQAEQLAGPHTLFMTQHSRTTWTDAAPGSGKAIASVYDCLSTRELGDVAYDWYGYTMSTQESLRHVVLCLDEAHELWGARHYRGTTLTYLQDLQDKILAAGGTVLHVTATPRKVEMMHAYKSVFRVDRGRTGAVGAQRIVVSRKRSNKISTLQHLTAVVAGLIKDGYTPLVRLNDKKALSSLQSALIACGAVEASACYILTADTKGYAIVTRADGTHDRQFDNEAAEHVMVRGALPAECRCLLTTSLLEAGTSIRGRSDEAGHVVADASIVPVYVPDRGEGLDLDRMIQFLSRLRYAYTQAVLVCTAPTARTERKDFDLEASYTWALNSLYSDVRGRAEAHNAAGAGRQHFKGDAGDGLEYVDGKWMPALGALHAMAWERVYQGISLLSDKALQTVLTAELGCPVEMCSPSVADVPAVRAQRGVPVPPETQKYVEEILAEPARRAAFLKALCTPYGIQTAQADVKALMHMSEGKTLAGHMRTLLSGYDGGMSAEDALTQAVTLVEDPALAAAQGLIARAVASTYDALGDRKLSVLSGLYSVYWWAHGGERAGMLLDARYKGLTPADMLPCDAFDSIGFSVQALTEGDSDRYGVLMAVLRLMREAEGLDWGECRARLRAGVLAYWATADTAECELYRTSYELYLLAEAERRGERAYIECDASRTGAIYEVLTRPETYFAEPDGPADADGLTPTRYAYPKGLVGKRLYKAELKEMAAQLPGLVDQLVGPEARRGFKPSGPDVERWLTCLYCVQVCTRPVPGKGLEQGVHVVKRRARMWVPGKGTQEPQALAFPNAPVCTEPGAAS